MEEKKDFFQKIHEKAWKRIAFFCVSMTVIIALYIQIDKILHRQVEIVTDDFSWVYQVDSIESKEKQLEIKGWAFVLNQDAGENQFEIILHNVETGKNIYPEISYEAREDVNEYFLCEYDYTQSGFTIVLSEKKLKGGVYEILLRPEDSKIAYSTGIYYTDGKMTFANPEEFVPLNVAGTDLETVVENGVLRVYRPDFGMYVYQYEGELYWIADESFYFEEDGTTYMEYQLRTTQIEKLPPHRLKNKWYFDNIGFYLEQNELIGWNVGNYRVSKAALPTEYAISNIETGYYNYATGEWIWVNHFRVYIEKEEGMK